MPSMPERIPAEPGTSHLHCHRMPRPPILTDDGVRRLRTAAQHLHRPRRLSAVDLIRHLAGVQAQQLPAAGLALRARTEGLTAERVDRSRLDDRSIVLTWAMRGTLHLVAAEDHGWLVPLVTEPRMANAHRRLNQEGVPPDEPPRAIRFIERMLEREGPLPRRQIAERLRRHGIRTQGQAIAHLVWLAAAQGVICRGPDGSSGPSFVLVRDWLGEPKRRERESALAELATRHLNAHGPAEPADLAYWSGIRLGDARRAWGAIQRRLVEVETARGPRWAIRSQKETAPRGLVRLLPSFDEYLLGWKDRDLVVPLEHRAHINRGGGWLHPVAVADGRVVATWSTERTSMAIRVGVHPFSHMSAAVGRAVASEAKDLGRFLGNAVELAVRPGATTRKVKT